MFGYILMLATMTFSVELLLCVIVGLGIGFILFYDERDGHVTTNPCCSFMQSESDERIEDPYDDCCCENGDDDCGDFADASYTTTSCSDTSVSQNSSTITPATPLLGNNGGHSNKERALHSIE